MGYRGRKQRPPDTAAAPQSSRACSTLKGSARHSPVPFFSLTRVIGAVSLKSCHCQSRNSKSSEEFLTPHCRIIACSIWAEFNYYTRIQVFPGCKVACLPGEGRRALEGGWGQGKRTRVSYRKEVPDLAFEADRQVTGDAFHRKSLPGSAWDDAAPWRGLKGQQKNPERVQGPCQHWSLCFGECRTRPMGEQH